MDYGETARSIANLPNSQTRRSTVETEVVFQEDKSESWIIKTTASEEGWYIQLINSDGDGVGHRFTLTPSVVKAIFRHRDSIMKERKKMRAQRAADTRRLKREYERSREEDQRPTLRLTRDGETFQTVAFDDLASGNLTPTI